MSGAACAVVIHSLVRSKTVPPHGRQQRELERQLRECYANPIIAEAVAATGIDTAMAVWETLEKEHLSEADLTFLLTGLDGLYE